MKKQIHKNDPISEIKHDLTIISLSTMLFEKRYGKYMDSNAKKHLQLITDSVLNLNKKFSSA